MKWTINKKRLTKIIIFIAIPLIAISLIMPFTIDGEINTFDEGTWLSDVNGLINGKILYRDIWFVYGPAMLYSLKVTMKLLGSTFATQRAFFWILNFIGFICVYMFVLKLLKNQFLSILTAVFILMTGCIHSTLVTPVFFRQCVGFLVLLFILNYLNNEKSLQLLLAGISSGIIFLFSHEIGLSVIFVMIVFLFFLKPKNIFFDYSKFFKGFLIIIVPFMVYLLVKGIFFKYIEVAFIDVFGIINKSEKSLSMLGIILKITKGLFSFKVKATTEFIAMFVIPIFYGTIISYYYINKRKTRNRYDIMIILLSIYGVLLCLYAFTRLDIWHAYFTLTPAIIISSIFCQKKLLKINSLNKNIRFFFILLIFWSFMVVPYAYDKLIRSSYINKISVSMNIERAGRMRVPEIQATHILKVVEYIKENTKKDDYIFVFPHQGLYYFLSERRNPIYYSIPFFANTEEKQKRVVGSLQKIKPEYTIITVSRWEYNNTSYDKAFSIIWKYITDNYSHTYKIGATYILRRNNVFIMGSGLDISGQFHF